MKIHEYQAKDLLKKFNVPVPQGDVATTSREARQVAEELADGPFVVKALIHAGGRGKGGGIKVAATFDEVEKMADQILGMTLVRPRPAPKARWSTRSWWSRPRTSPRSSTWGWWWTAV